MMQISRLVAWAALALLFGVILLQGYAVVRQTLSLSERKIVVNRGNDPISRGADAAYGGEFQGYINFLRERIPETASVVVSPTTGLPQYSSVPFMQYFMFPRQIIQCSPDDPEICFQEFEGPDVFFIEVEGEYEIIFPDDAVEVEHFNERLALLRSRP